jgi:hypothetical protein
MKWAKNHGAEICHGAIRATAEGGNLETLKWLMEEAGRDEGEKKKAKEEKRERRRREEGGGREEQRGKKAKGWKEGRGESRESKKRKEEVVRGAAEGGHMPILLWAKEEGLISSTPLVAAKKHVLSPDLEILKWLKKEGYEVVTDMHMFHAINEGQVDILKWLASEDPDLAKKFSRSSRFIWACRFAIRKNSVDILKLVQEIFTIPRSTDLTLEAASRGNFEIFKYLRNLDCAWNEFTCSMIAGSGNFEMFIWARRHGCPWEERTCASAARRGFFEILKYAHEHGCPWDETTCSSAAQSGDLEMLKWARERGCPWDKSTCSTAARFGNLEILQWAREHGCPWTKSTCYSVEHGRSLEILKWARGHGCPWSKKTCFFAIDHNNIGILEWAFMNGCPCTPKEIFEYAAESENADALNWVKKHIPKMTDPNFLANFKIEAWSPDIFAWIKKNGIPFPDDFPSLLLRSENLPSLLWLVQQNLPPEFRGVWRDAVEAFDHVVVGKTEKPIMKILGKVIKDPTRVGDLIKRMLREYRKNITL